MSNIEMSEDKLISLLSNFKTINRTVKYQAIEIINFNYLDSSGLLRKQKKENTTRPLSKLPFLILALTLTGTLILGTGFHFQQHNTLADFSVATERTDCPKSAKCLVNVLEIKQRLIHLRSPASINNFIGWKELIN